MDTIIGQQSQGGNGAAGVASIVDADQATFVKEVIEASRTVPVLVDFWATWCGPCKTLTPTLERVVTAAAGRVKLVKVDVDKNRALVEQLSRMGLPMQSIPTVAAFWQGQIADIFQGALPESEVKRFIEQLLKLSGGSMPAADMLAEAQAALEEGEAQEAGELFSAVIATEPENPAAWGGLVRSLWRWNSSSRRMRRWTRCPSRSAAMLTSRAPGAPWPWPKRGRKRPPGWSACNAGSRPIRPITRRGTISPPR